tara:strand:- start:102102 stop:102782 length:681 start_codon:yes stop_codon:yes gene_type:complete
MTQFAFLHLPKTAGLAFREGLVENFGVGQISRPIPEMPPLSVQEYERLAPLQVITGHFSGDTYAELFPKRRLLVILREPIDRCLSAYFFHRALPWWSLNSEDARRAALYPVGAHFALPPDLLRFSYANRMTRQLGGETTNLQTDLDQALAKAKQRLLSAFWVGFQETIVADVDRLRQRPEFDAFPALNEVNPTAQKSPVGANTRSRVAEMNAYDMELYAWARNQFG